MLYRFEYSIFVPDNQLHHDIMCTQKDKIHAGNILKIYLKNKYKNRNISLNKKVGNLVK